MKDFVINTNTVILYIALGAIWISAVVVFNFTQSFWASISTFVLGTLGWCIVSGFWFVQSATYEELRKLNSKTS